MATKAEIIETLTAQGIQHDPNALKAELEALLPEQASTGPVENVADVSRVTTDDVEKNGLIGEFTGFEPAEVGVYDPKGHIHRSFSIEVHGADFKQLAETYVSHRPGWTVR